MKKKRVLRLMMLLVMASALGALFLVLPVQPTHAHSTHPVKAQIGLLAITATTAVTDTQVENEPNEPPVAQIFIEPGRVQVLTGDTEQTSVGVETDAAVFQVELRLVFDPLIVAVVDADPDEDGVQLAIERPLTEQEITVVRNQVDNESGLIELALLKSWPDTPIDVGYGLATITWLGLEEGIAEVTLAEARLADENGKPIFYEAHGSTIEVTAVKEPQISGRIFLQGRLNHNGTNIYISDRLCTTLIQEKSINLPNTPASTTNEAGYFLIENTEGKTYRCLLAVKRGYLTGVYSFPNGNLGTITLPGGDISGDNVVDIFDIAYIGSHYGDNDRLVDINGDGIVSIFDLVITASNYGLRGPVNW